MKDLWLAEQDKKPLNEEETSNESQQSLAPSLTKQGLSGTAGEG